MMSGSFVRYSVASWRRKNSWSSTAAAAAAGSAGGAVAFLLFSSSSDDEYSSTYLGKGCDHLTKAEPLLYYDRGDSVVLGDRPPRFVDTFNPTVISKPAHHHQQEPASTTTTTTAASSSKQHHTHQQVSIRAIKNARITMEDEYCIHDNSFYAIFDGHGGGGVSKYLKQHLYDKVRSYQHQQGDAPARALQKAFADIEKFVTANEQLRYQGSTAVVVWITDQEIIAANVGDSRAVLSRNGSAMPLTRDHKPNDEQERDRILQMGESIAWDRFSKVHRVKNLSLSRAIGDAYAKPVVSATVDIKHFPLNTTTTSSMNSSSNHDGNQDRSTDQNHHQAVTDEFVILASDGLWDVFTSDEAVAFCHARLKELDTIEDLTDRTNGKTVLRRNMAKFLTREAVARGSGDNVCVVMIWLDDKDATAS